MEVYNEEWGFTYDGSSISNMEDMSQYWFYNNYDTDEEFHKKIDSAAKSLYKDLQSKYSVGFTHTLNTILVHHYFFHFQPFFFLKNIL